MCEYAKVPYEHINDFPSIAQMCSAFGAGNGNFAPPVAVINGKAVSQSTAACLFVGKRCGLTAGMDEDVAPQLFMDIIDTFEGGLGGAQGKGGAALKAFLEGPRWAALAGNVDRSIQGPFYFGETMTCVDFFLANIISWFKTNLLDRLEAEKGVKALAQFPKILGVYEAMSALPTFNTNKYNLLVSTKPDGSSFIAGDQLFADYK